MTMPANLLSLLRDPIGLAPLELDGEALVNLAAQRRYSINDSIPALLEQADLGPQNLKMQNMYRWMARGFDWSDRLANLITRGSLIKYRRLMASKLGIKAGDRLLYTSIGTGLDMPFLGEQVSLDAIELIGLDLSREMLKECQKKLRRHEKTCMLVQANAERLPLADGVFDLVWHVGGINLFDKPAVAVREMIRVARPGAFIMIADETKAEVKNQYQKNPLTKPYCKDMPTNFDPREWLPSEINRPQYEELAKGRVYVLTFRTPLS
jgi:ubiquinone/menaquinone biosynthesis C-methylase UbiE